MICEFCEGATETRRVKRHHWLHGKLYLVENVEAEVCRGGSEGSGRGSCRWDIWKEVKEKERWTSLLLFKAATAVARSLKNEEIRRYWDTAWFLHVEGFHEGKLDIDLVRERTRDIEELVSLAEADRSGDRRNRDE